MLQAANEWHHRLITTPPSALRTPRERLSFQVESLVDRRLATYGDADRLRNRLPKKGLFLFAPPRPDLLDLRQLMSYVSFNNRNGVSYLGTSCVTFALGTPKTPHLLVDVEDGHGRLNTKSKVSRENITNGGRTAYDLWYGILHAILFPESLKYHYMALVGERRPDGAVPHLYIGIGPALDRHCEDYADPAMGAPSAGGIILP
jgi:hypothetical protein